MEEKVIVAIELGSSKISGVAGQIMTDGSLKVLAYAGVPSSSCIRHGAVYNLDKTANAIAEVVERLNSILSTSIEKVYVGYNAKGLKSILSKVEPAVGRCRGHCDIKRIVAVLLDIDSIVHPLVGLHSRGGIARGIAVGCA